MIKNDKISERTKNTKMNVTSNVLTTIRPKKLFSVKDITEIWKYRELLFFFTWRDLKVRYKQTIISPTSQGRLAREPPLRSRGGAAKRRRGCA